MKAKEKFGQLFSMDILIAIGVGLLMLTFVVMFWNLNSNNLNLKQERIEMQRTAFDASNELMEITLVDGNNIFDPEKVVNFISGPYNQTKEELGLGGYEFHLTIKNENGQVMEINSTPLEYGISSENSTETIVVKRVGSLNKCVAILTLEVWK